mmetsp:Transcript_95226/g.274236  ORF Transcript_95226/g.274236 Transcript_95226/m.274236 type:complete len:200 (-) Transcript_95226:6-605(-)
MRSKRRTHSRAGRRPSGRAATFCSPMGGKLGHALRLSPGERTPFPSSSSSCRGRPSMRTGSRNGRTGSWEQGSQCRFTSSATSLSSTHCWTPWATRCSPSRWYRLFRTCSRPPGAVTRTRCSPCGRRSSGRRRGSASPTLLGSRASCEGRSGRARAARWFPLGESAAQLALRVQRGISQHRSRLTRCALLTRPSCCFLP